MKKLLILTLIIMFIPFIIVSFFIQKEIETVEIKTNKNTIIRIKTDNGIITKPLEEYVIGVLAGEMPASFEEEALKAQSVAARTYVLKKRQENQTNEYDVTADIMNQVYIDEEQMKNKWQDEYEKYYQKLKKIVIETTGEYLTYQGEIIQVFFFSTSSGKTENSEDVFSEALPYLKSVESTWDVDVAPAFNEITTFTLADFYQKLNLNYDENLTINVIEKATSGRNKIIEINGQTFKTTDIRSKLNLKSADFTITKSDKNVLITTKGYGHGVGMSQYGAQAMAKKGYKYDEILKYYFQNVEISKLEV